jgi:hypothetical protein
MSHPVQFRVDVPAGPRDRLTILLRPILAIPHVLLVGGPVVGLLGGAYRAGALGVMALLVALFDWILIVFGGQPIAGLQSWKRLYVQWRGRVLAYCAFLRDEYPPFGDGPYPAVVELPEPPATRDRADILLRPIMALPHLVVLAILVVAWALTAIVSWFWLVATGDQPASLWRFGRDVMAYSLRVESYILLLHDQFPPFALSEPEADTAAPAPLTRRPEPVGGSAS